MKFLLLFCLLLVCFGSGCGSSSSSNATANSNTTAIANASSANVATAVPYTSANGAAIDANAANPTNANQAQIKVITPPPGNPKPMTFPAPDNSEYSSTMDKSGQAVETRVFHSDPLISKVERVWKGVDEKAVSIYLKNGKIVKVPGDKWPDIKSQPVQTFYEAAGVKPPQPVTNGTPAVRKGEKPQH